LHCASHNIYGAGGLSCFWGRESTAALEQFYTPDSMRG